MRLLIITGSLFPNLDANSEIAYRIAKTLHTQYGYCINILGSKNVYEKRKFSSEIEEIPVAAISKYRSIKQRYRNKLLQRLVLLFSPRACWFVICLKFGKKDTSVKIYKKQLEKLLSKKKYAGIIAFSAPVEPLVALSQINTSVPIIYYKLDPWSTNYNNHSQATKEIELESDRKAKWIILSDVLKKEYSEFYDKELSKKIIVLDYPNVVNKKCPVMANSENMDGTITCVFAGGLYADIRNPEYMINVFKQLKDCGIVLHIYGYQSGQCIDEDQLPENIVYHGMVTAEEAEQRMQQADILVNIGNTINNQMPSKLLTYISFGKPIINFVKISDCPTLRFIERYPSAINIFESNESNKDAVVRVRDFCLKNNHRTIPFEIIRKLYYQCTPEYVCEKIVDLLNASF